MNGTERETIRSAGLFKWISTAQEDVKGQYDHGWWRSMEFLQLLSHDFEDFGFDVMSTFLMPTPPPTSMIPMPLVAARSTKLEIIFKEDWVVEPYYTATVKLNFPGPIVLLGILEPIDPANKWLLRVFLKIASTSHTARVLPLFPAQSKMRICCTRCFIF